MKKKQSQRRLIVILLAVVVVLGAAAIPNLLHLAQPMSMAQATELPAWVKQYPTEVQEAYAYAATHREVLKMMSCYCGCENHGDSSNADCYIEDVGPNGKLRYDSHAAT